MPHYSKGTIEKLWNKLPDVKGYDPKEWKKDFAGAWIKRMAYCAESKYGWVICRLTPAHEGGTDEFDNLRPMHWKNARTKGYKYPCFETSVTSDGEENIEKTQKWKIK